MREFEIGGETMSNMNEFNEIMAAIKQAWNRGEQAALVILIKAWGSAYRAPGAKMLFTSNGGIVGSISPGCLEQDLSEWASQAMETEEAMLHTYDLSNEEVWGLGIGCKGSLELLILPICKTKSIWQTADEWLQEGQGFSLVVELPQKGIALVDANGRQSGSGGAMTRDVFEQARIVLNEKTRAEVIHRGKSRFFLDPVRPDEKLIIAGAGPDTAPVAALAEKAGFSISILDSGKNANRNLISSATILRKKPEGISPNEVSQAWWVIMNHHMQTDEQALRLAMKSDPRYVGILGPFIRTEEILSRMGITIHDGPFHAPVGLDLGAETMDEVAISIVAELMAVKNQRNPKHLHKKVNIHG